VRPTNATWCVVPRPSTCTTRDCFRRRISTHGTVFFSTCENRGIIVWRTFSFHPIQCSGSVPAPLLNRSLDAITARHMAYCNSVHRRHDLDAAAVAATQVLFVYFARQAHANTWYCLPDDSVGGLVGCDGFQCCSLQCCPSCLPAALCSRCSLNCLSFGCASKTVFVRGFLYTIF
jgi:hypothetical protein